MTDLDKRVQAEALDERDIYEVANQLEGYVGPDTPEPLAAFLLRESNEAAKLAEEIVRLRTALASLPEAPAVPVVLEKRPVAFRVKDYADGWILFSDEEDAWAEAEAMGGALMQGLYARDGSALSPPAPTAAVDGEVAKAVWVLMDWDDATLNDSIPTNLSKRMRAALSPGTAEEEKS